MCTRPLIPGLSLAMLTACMSATAVTPRADLLGSPVPAHAGTRVVNVTPGMHSINVVAGDTIRFVNGSGEFGWSFDVSPIVQTFDLNEVAPSGALGHPLQVYVAPSPLYSERAQFNDLERQDPRLPKVVR